MTTTIIVTTFLFWLLTFTFAGIFKAVRVCAMHWFFRLVRCKGSIEGIMTELGHVTIYIKNKPR